MNGALSNHDPWTLMNGVRSLGTLIADTQDGITEERRKLAWMATTGSHADLAEQVRAIAALEARLSTLKEAQTIFTPR